MCRYSAPNHEWVTLYTITIYLLHVILPEWIFIYLLFISTSMTYLCRLYVDLMLKIQWSPKKGYWQNNRKKTGGTAIRPSRPNSPSFKGLSSILVLPTYCFPPMQILAEEVCSLTQQLFELIYTNSTMEFFDKSIMDGAVTPKNSSYSTGG